METKHTFKNENYNLSTDYKLLWELAKQDNRIAAWQVYTDKYKEPIWDIVEIRKNKYNDTIQIGRRGYTYYEDNNFEDFINTCIIYSLHFIAPINETNL